MLAALFPLVMATSCAAPPPFVSDCSRCPEMVEIPAGRFLMGSTDSEAVAEGVPVHHAEAEWPQHEVVIERPFLLGRYEVTRGEYAAFVADTGHPSRECLVYEHRRYQPATGSSWQSPTFEQGDDHPAVCVAWEDADAYVRWLSAETGQRYRLPSEAEWEYAARAGSVAARYWDADTGDACAHANVADRASERPQFDCTDPYRHTAPVGYGIPNAFGLYGMLGNVGELVADCGLPDYADAGNSGTAVTSGDCGKHVGRGGSYWNDAYYLRAARRYSFAGAYTIVGFRVARDL